MEGSNKFKKITDEEIVERIVRNKEDWLFAVLYDRYANIIYNKGLLFVNNKTAAADATQDIFLKLFVKLGTFSGEAKFSTWLYAFVYNFFVNYVQRTLKKNKQLFVSAVVDDLIIKVEDQVEDIDMLKSDKLMQAMDHLDPDDKSILLMKYQDDFTIKELQQVFGIGESAVKMRLNRAKYRVVEIYKAL